MDVTLWSSYLNCNFENHICTINESDGAAAGGLKRRNSCAPATGIAQVLCRAEGGLLRRIEKPLRLLERQQPMKHRHCGRLTDKALTTYVAYATMRSLA